MIATVDLFVGADNDTGLVDRDLLAKILDSSHDGWTMYDAVGSWRGQREPSVTVVLCDELDTILATARQIRDELHQDAVAYRVTSPMTFV